MYVCSLYDERHLIRLHSSSTDEVVLREGRDIFHSSLHEKISAEAEDAWYVALRGR